MARAARRSARVPALRPISQANSSQAGPEIRTPGCGARRGRPRPCLSGTPGPRWPGPRSPASPGSPPVTRSCAGGTSARWANSPATDSSPSAANQPGQSAGWYPAARSTWWISTSDSRRASVYQAGCPRPRTPWTADRPAGARHAGRLGRNAAAESRRSASSAAAGRPAPASMRLIAGLLARVLRGHHARAGPDQQVTQPVGVPGQVREHMPAAPARQRRGLPGLAVGQPGGGGQQAAGRVGYPALQELDLLPTRNIVHSTPIVVLRGYPPHRPARPSARGRPACAVPPGRAASARFHDPAGLAPRVTRILRDPLAGRRHPGMDGARTRCRTGASAEAGRPWRRCTGSRLRPRDRPHAGARCRRREPGTAPRETRETRAAS